VARAVTDGWGVHAATVEYVPEGGGSHHWRLVADDGAAYFATVDDLDDKDRLGDSNATVLDGLVRALRTSAALRVRAGLDFVLAPLADRDGEVLRRVTDRYTVSLFPFLTGGSHPFGPYEDRALQDRALTMIIALHQATDAVTDVAPMHTIRFSGRHDLDAFLVRPTEQWDGGPFGEPARALFTPRVHELDALVCAFDRLLDTTAAGRADTVITHGEPHPGNLLSVDDDVLLIDWDTAALGPPERDLWLITTDPDDLARYEQATGRRAAAAVLTVYRLRWFLDDLGSAIRMFRNPHRDTADAERWLNGIAPRLAQLPEWVERVS
jgi:spectinomycin phosphotransferase